MSVREILAGKAVVEIGLRNRIEKGLKAVSGRLKRFSTGLRSLSGAFTAAGGSAMAGLGGPLALVGSTFASFDGKMAEVSAIAGVTGASLDALRDKAKDLGMTTRFSATEAAEAMKFLGMAGMDSTQIMSAIDPVLNVAAAGMLDLGRAADIVSDATTAFGLSAEETERVADVMARTATSSNTSIEQMGDAFTYAAAQGKAAGQTVEDVSAALGVLGNSGLKASVAGSGVQGVFKRMITPEATSQLRKLGMSIADSSGRIRPLADLMTDLRDRTAGFTQLKRLQTFEGIFGLHSKSALVLASNADQLSKLTGELQGAKGAASDMAGAMQNSLMGTLLSLKSAGQSILIELGEALNEPASAFIGSIIQIARATSQFIKANKPLFKILSLVALGVMAAGAALLAIGGIGLIASFAIAGLASVLSMAGAAIGFLMGPGGAVLALLAGLAGAVYYFRDAIYQFLAPLMPTFNAIREAVANFGQIFMQTWGGALAAMSQGDLGKAGTIAMAGLSAALWTGVADIAKVVSSMLDLLTGWLPGLDTIRDYATQVFGSIGQAILAGRWDLAGHILLTKLQIVFEGGWSKIALGWNAFTIGIATVFDKIASSIRSTWRSAVFEIARWIVWVGEKLGIVGGGTQAMLEQMRSEAQANDDRSASRRDAARHKAGQAKLDAANARQAELAQQLALLEQESAEAHVAAGAPTLDDRAAKAREELAQAITTANEKADEQGVASDDLGVYQSAAKGGVKQASKMTSTGTFSAAAASLMGLGANKAADRTAANTGKQVMLTRKLLKKPAAKPQFGT